MYSSPVRRFTSVLLHLLARLACIRRAASVRSEPGSNSQIGVVLELDQGPPLQYTLHLAQLPLFSCQRTTAFFTRAAHYTARTIACQGTHSKNLRVVSLLVPHRDSPSGAVSRQERNNHRTSGRYQGAGKESREKHARMKKISPSNHFVLVS